VTSLADGGRETRFAPAARDADALVHEQAAAVSRAALDVGLFDLVNEPIIVLNRHRQLVFVNRQMADDLGLENREQVYGERPGEAVHCIHAASPNTPAGCGTGLACQTCGAIRAVLRSQTRGAATEDCTIVVSGGQVVTFRIKATQLAVGAEEYTVVAMRDIGDGVWRREMERAFLHDILNLAGAMHGLLEFGDRRGAADRQDYWRLCRDSARTLVESIDGHRMIVAAEAGDLPVRGEMVDLDAMIRGTIGVVSHHPVAADRHLVIDPASVFGPVVTDRGILSRILVNMLKNALEAEPPGGTVRIGCGRDPADGGGNGAWIAVHNPGHMSQKVAAQVFRRFFSTKGDGRGIGTYSMKLLGERYLGGAVTFTSEPATGTTFVLRLPHRAPGGQES